MSEVTELLEPGKLVSDLSEEDAFVVLKHWYLQDMKYNSPWYSEAKIDYGFESGDQWEEREIAELEERRRLHVTMNRVKPTVDVICGMEVTNRQEVTYIPRTTADPLPQVDPQTGQQMIPQADWDDSQAVEGYTEIARWIRDTCDAEDEESDMFRDTVICGMGWTQTLMDYEDDPEGEVIIDRRDPLTMGWDHTATKRNLDDSKRFHETKRDIPVEDAHDQYPDVDISDLHADWAFETRLTEGFEHDRELARYYGNKTGGEEVRSKITMVIIEWAEVRTRYRVLNPATGEAMDMSGDEFKELSERTKKIGLETLTYHPVKQKKWMKAVLGNKLLSIGPAACDYASSYKCTTGYRDRNRRQWYGIVRPMRDPQKWANKFFSVALEQIATSGKGIIAEVGTFVDDKRAEEEWAKTGNIAFVKPGKIGSITPKPQPPMLTGLADLMQLSLAGIRDVTGVNQETVGLAERDQAASLEYQRRQAGVTILAAFFDNLRRYRKEQGRVLLYFIQHYLSDGRIVRILGEQGTPKLIQLIKQPDTVKYDVIVDQAPSSPNQKEASWMVTQQLIPLVAKMGIPAPVMFELLKMSPLPASGVQKLERAFSRAQEQQAAQGPSLDQQKLQAEVGKINAEAAGKQIDAQLKAQELQVRQVEAELGLQTTALTLQDNVAKRDHDMRLREMDMGQRRMELQAEAGAKEAEAMGPQLPGMINGIGEGLMALAQALMQSQTVQGQELKAGFNTLSEAQRQLAMAMLAPKQAILSPDGNSAIVEPVRMQ